MGIELVSVCVFCASVLLRTEFAPPPGISAEIGGSYSKIQRKYDTPPYAPDFSNVTPKFVLVGLRQAWSATGDLGAGTPAREWAVRGALGPSHDEQEQLPSGAPGLTTAAGTGRYENVALLYRQPVGAADSMEAGWVRRKTVSTDAVNLGQSNYVLSEQRILSSERRDLAVGWRHRFRGVEIDLSGRMTTLEAGNQTAAYSGAFGGNLFGGGVEVRWRTGPLTFLAYGEALSGNLDTREESFPDFAQRIFSASAFTRSVSAHAGYTWPKTDVGLSYTVQRNGSPFTTFAVLGAETDALDRGFHAESRASLSTFGFRVRTEVGAGIRIYGAFSATVGDETVELTDSSGAAPPRTLHVHWAEVADPAANQGRVPGYVVTIGAEFSIGGRSR